MRFGFSLVAAFGFAAMLSACAVLPGGGPAALDTFELTAPSVSASAQRRARTQLLVAGPSALRILDGENVVIRTSANSIEYLSGAQWADSLPSLVQARLAQTLDASGGLGGVGRPGEGLAIDYQLITDIRAFEVRVDGPRRAHVEIFARILNDRNGVVQTSRSFSATVPVGVTGNAGYIAALDQAFAQVTGEIVQWTVSSL